MLTNTRSAAWAVEHRALARSRLLTAARELSSSLQVVGRMLGVMEGADITDRLATLDARLGAEVSKNLANMLELGMTEVQSHLLHVIHALDMAPDITPPETPYAKRDRKS